MGSDAIALPLLDALAADTRVALAGVYTQPDRPAGRGQHLQPNAIKRWALAHAIPVAQPAKLTEDERGRFAALRPDLVLVMAYGHILRQAWIDTPSLGMFNLHTSLLPKYRGAAPMQGALVSGETQTGVTLMKLVRKLDAGPIVDTAPVAVDALETGETLERKLAEVCPLLVLRQLDALLSGAAPLRPQDDALATFTRRLRKEDGVLDFFAPAAVLARRINGLFPWPGTGFAAGDCRLRLGLAEADGTRTDAEPGTVLDGGGREVRIATSEGVLGIRQLQRPGGKMLPAADFLRGFPLAPGMRIESHPMPPLVAREPFKA